MDQKFTTASGIEIPASDIKDIQKRSTKETLKNAAAAIGIVASVLFLKKQLEGRNIKIAPLDK